MQFGYTIIYVADVEETISFYEQALNLKPLFIAESKQYAELDTGNTKLAFVSEAFGESNEFEFVKNNKNKTTAGFVIAFITEDIHNAYKNACAKGAVAVKDPVKQPWGQITAHVRDINGVTIEICTPMK